MAVDGPESFRLQEQQPEDNIQKGLKRYPVLICKVNGNCAELCAMGGLDADSVQLFGF